MTIISEIQEERASLPFNASLDPSNPLGFLEKVLDFIGKESDFLSKDTAEKEIANAVTAAKKRLKEAEKEEKESVEPLEKLNKESLKPTEPIEVENPKEEEVKFGALPNEGNVNVTLGEVPNKGNGLDFEMYSWTQNRQEVIITIPVPSGTNPRSVTCKFDWSRLKVCLGGVHTIIDGALFNAVKSEECFWITVDEKVIWVVLTKKGYEWWKYCMKGEPEIDTRKVVPGSSKLDDLDPETRSRVERMMLDQREKQDSMNESMAHYRSRIQMKKRRFRNNLIN